LFATPQAGTVLLREYQGERLTVWEPTGDPDDRRAGIAIFFGNAHASSGAMRHRGFSGGQDLRYVIPRQLVPREQLEELGARDLALRRIVGAEEGMKLFKLVAQSIGAHSSDYPFRARDHHAARRRAGFMFRRLSLRR
jgi:hypothetical protein